MKNVLLFGAGTQSTGLLLMALDGVFPVPDLTIFADTGGEPQFVYDYFKKARAYIKGKYGYEITVLSRGAIDQDIFDAKKSYKRVAGLPLFTQKGGMVRRQCTAEYKIEPITKYIKGWYDIRRKRKDSRPLIKRWFGISLDEIERCRVSQDWWAENDYPLVKERMYRHEVIDYINNRHPELKGPKRSSCYFCPFHSDDYWSRLKMYYLNEFVKACKIDRAIRINPKVKQKLYLHRSTKPLSKIDFKKYQYEIFGECEGYCGI